jgi:hypothetical protein
MTGNAHVNDPKGLGPLCAGILVSHQAAFFRFVACRVPAAPTLLES